MNNKNTKAAALMLIPIALAIGVIAFYIAGDSNIKFEDENLELAVRKELNIQERDIRIEDIKQVEELDLSYSGIETLEGIDKFGAIRDLNLEGNRIENIEPLKDLAYLEQLNLRGNQIKNVSVLKDHKRLVSLDLRNTGISNLEFISGLTQLTDLNVRGNNIKSLQPLVNLTQLRSLNVRSNRIKDISVLESLQQLEDLNLRKNKIEDFSPVFQLPHLTKRLYVKYNPGLDLNDFVQLYEKVDDMDINDPGLAVTFNQKGGIYPSAQTIELRQLLDKKGTIRYTLDGSEPTEISKEYGKPIRIKDTTVVKAKFFDRYGNPGEMSANTYIIDNKNTFPVVSLSGNPEDFFSESFGIYSEGAAGDKKEVDTEEANYAQSGDLWEREATVEMYSPEGAEMLHQQAGVRIHGNKSRKYPKKSFRLYARSDYDVENTFNYPLFESEDRSEFNRLILRNSGSDWQETLFRDAFLQDLIKDFDIETQAFQPVNLYLNGDYWGVYNLRERIDHHYFEFKYGILEENLEFLENNSVVRTGNNRHYEKMISYIKQHDITDPKVYEKVTQQMDINNFIDYNAAEIYVRNLDWPGNNNRYWREVPHGKWRWTIYDLDFGFGKKEVEETAAHQTLDFATEEGNMGWPNPDWSTFLLRTLLENNEFRARFAGTFSHYLNTHFNDERVIKKLNEFEALYEPEMKQNIDRWGEPKSIDTWRDNVNIMREFGKVRDDYMYAHLVDSLGLSGYTTLAFSTDKDRTIQIYGKGVPLNKGKWTGMYTADTPLEITVDGKPSVLKVKEGKKTLVDEQGRLVTSSTEEAEMQIVDQQGEAVGTIKMEGTPVKKEMITLEVGQSLNWGQRINTGSYASVDDKDLGKVGEKRFTAEKAGEGLITIHDKDNKVISMARINIVQPADEARLYNEDHPAVSYEGKWLVSKNDSHHDGTALYSGDEFSQLMVTFKGTGIRWYGYSGPTQGIAGIEVDGKKFEEIDTYSKNGSFHKEIHTIGDLEPGKHTMIISVTGKKNEEARNNRIHIDGFEVLKE